VLVVGSGVRSALRGHRCRASGRPVIVVEGAPTIGGYHGKNPQVPTDSNTNSAARARRTLRWTRSVTCPGRISGTLSRDLPNLGIEANEFALMKPTYGQQRENHRIIGRRQVRSDP